MDTDPSASSFTAERRRSSRHSWVAPVTVIDETCIATQAVGVDVSRGGLRVTSDVPLDLGSQVELWLPIEPDVTLELQAEVVDMDPNGMRLRFVGIEEQETLQFEAYLRRRLKPMPLQKAG